MEEPLDVLQLQIQVQQKFPNAVAQLVVFRRQYLQRLDTRRLAWPSSHLLAIYDVQRWLYPIISNPWHAKSRTRQDAEVLTELVKRIERALVDTEEADVFDSLVELCAQLCVKPRLPVIEAAQQDVWVLYEIPGLPSLVEDATSIKLFEKPRILSASGCSGYRTWQAALALAQKLVTEWIPQKLLLGKKVLELGAGTGLLSLLCASAGGAERVVATDGDKDAVRRLEISRTATGHSIPDLATRIKCGVYCWAEPFEGSVIQEELDCGPFDVVLAADVTYDPTSIPSLVSTLRSLLDLNPATVVVVSATLRNQATFDGFIDTCTTSGLVVHLSECASIPLSNQSSFFRTDDELVIFISITIQQAQVDSSTDVTEGVHS